MKIRILIICMTLSWSHLLAQHSSPPPKNLNRLVSIRITNQRVEYVLEKLSEQGHFYFSYSGTLPQKDSLVSISVNNTSIRLVLDQLFRGTVDYKENGKYIILRSTTKHFSIIPQTINSQSRHYLIDGFVVDSKTGEKVKNASVYEKRLLQSTLSDDEGYFKLRFRGEHKSIILTLSKEDYRDTSMLFLSNVNVRPQGYSDSTSETSSGSNLVERFGLGRFLVSSKQRIQSLNIPAFFANSPFQASLLPGLSTHGMLSSQVINKGSLNLLGGYTAGVNGVELAGVFNINKNNMHKVQAGGVLNVVGGSVIGIQAGGVMNAVLDSVVGVQVAGVANNVRHSVTGLQVAGVFNRAGKNLSGTQISGVANLTSGTVQGTQISGVINTALKSIEGTQIAGVGNITTKTMEGVQVAYIFNFAKRMEGVQVGLVNLADTSAGYSIGLLNLVRKGYHKISLSSNEVMNANLRIKTGNAKLYSILIGGMNISDTSKVMSAGLGMGHDFIFNNKISLAAEISSQFIYLGSWNQTDPLNKLQFNLQYKAMKNFSIYAGPAYSIYISDPSLPISPGYKQRVIPVHHHSYSSKVKGWIGWNVGITFF